MKQTETGGRELVPAPRFRRRNGTAKIRPVNGFKGGDFANAKYYPALDWSDRRSGLNA